MNFRKRRVEDSEINITPLIDVVFLLLIFFMVSTTFKQDFEVGIDLPKSSSEANLLNRTIEITIDATGRYYVNHQQLVNTHPDTLRRALAKVAGDDRNLPVILSADGKTPHQAVITALDAARQLGFSRLTFATQQESK
ncbi:MAG: biopolymer transporter ExbD [Gammaproteobacteria bacterium]|nr:biopolymer transporter ExbD [Gammaproteobacteria bacterium]